MRRIIAVIFALGALVVLPAWFSPAAFADGDPASDVLLTQPLFVPPDAGLSAEQDAQLTQLIRRSTRAGYPIRVALINSASDLGTVTQLWKNPQTYGRYLGLELGDVWHGATLVVMPQGYGLYIPLKKNITVGDDRVMEQSVVPGSQLAEGAFATVEKLAAANGVTVNVGRVSVTGGSGSGSAVPWIAFAAGLLLVGGCWGASVRARPLRREVAA